MATFFTSDQHLGHANISRLAGRPFTDAEEMNAALLSRWNDVVGPDDVVWVLGDWALGRIEESLAWTSLFAGTKYLVRGNHDRGWAGDRKGHQAWAERYLEAGFAAVHDGLLDVTVDGRAFLLSHFPYAGDSGAQDRYPDHRPVDRGRWLLCGHVHEAWQQNGRAINVGVDAWDGRPVRVEQLLPLIAAGPRRREAAAWTSQGS